MIDDGTAVIEWDGTKYGIAPSDQMRLIRRVEDILGGSAVQKVLTYYSGGVTDGQLAEALGCILRAGGAKVSDLELYRQITDAQINGDASAAASAQNVIIAVLGLLAPPIASEMAEKAKAQSEEKKVSAKA